MSSTRQCHGWSDRSGGQRTPTARAPAQPGAGDQLAHSPCLLDEKVLLFMQLVQVSQAPAHPGGLHFFLGRQPQLLLVLALLYSWTSRGKDTCHPCVGAMSPHRTVQNTEVPSPCPHPGQLPGASQAGLLLSLPWDIVQHNLRVLQLLCV